MSSNLIKTALLSAIATMLQGVSGLASIKRDWQLPEDLGATDGQGNALLPLPALIFYEDEERLEIKNRAMWNELDLDLVFFAAFSGDYTDESSPCWQAFKDAADSIAGQIHALWHNRDALAPLRATGLIRVEERQNLKWPYDDNNGQMVLPVRITYGYPLGQPFQ